MVLMSNSDLIEMRDPSLTFTPSEIDYQIGWEAFRTGRSYLDCENSDQMDGWDAASLFYTAAEEHGSLRDEPGYEESLRPYLF